MAAKSFVPKAPETVVRRRGELSGFHRIARIRSFKQSNAHARLSCGCENTCTRCDPRHSVCEKNSVPCIPDIRERERERQTDRQREGGGMKGEDRVEGGGGGSDTLSAIARNSKVLRDAAVPRSPLLRHEGVLVWILLDSGLTVGARAAACARARAPRLYVSVHVCVYVRT